jgi:hypothetical protein
LHTGKLKWLLGRIKVLRGRVGQSNFKWLADGFEEVTGMEQTDSGKALDADILQCRADILRARQNTALTETKKHKTKEEKEQVTESPVTSTQTTQAPPAIESPTQPLTEKEKAKIELKSNIPARKQTAYVHNSEKENYETQDVSVATNQKDEKPSEEAGHIQNNNEIKIIKQVKSLISDSKQAGGQQVPRFNLAEQIMAEQRKSSATKRKAPNRNVVSVKQPAYDTGLTDSSRQEVLDEEKEFASTQQEIIAWIVRQDIERLCEDKKQREQKRFSGQRF